MKQLLKTTATNWINLVGVLVGVYIYYVIYTMIGEDFHIIQAMLSALILVGLYGLIFWIGFAFILILTDVILMIRFKTYLRLKLIIQWIVISIPFLYWYIEYGYQLFLVAVIIFFFTQLIREKIVKNINED